MSRSLKKGPFIDFKLAKKVNALGDEDRTIIKTWALVWPEKGGPILVFGAESCFFLGGVCLLDGFGKR